MAKRQQITPYMEKFTLSSNGMPLQSTWWSIESSSISIRMYRTTRSTSWLIPFRRWLVFLSWRAVNKYLSSLTSETASHCFYSTFQLPRSTRVSRVPKFEMGFRERWRPFPGFGIFVWDKISWMISWSPTNPISLFLPICKRWMSKVARYFSCNIH